MSHKKYIVDVTDVERTSLHDLITKGTTTARRFTRAYLLLAVAQCLFNHSIHVLTIATALIPHGAMLVQ